MLVLHENKNYFNVPDRTLLFFLICLVLSERKNSAEQLCCCLISLTTLWYTPFVLPVLKRNAISHYSAQIVWINARVNAYCWKLQLAYQSSRCCSSVEGTSVLSHICFGEGGEGRGVYQGMKQGVELVICFKTFYSLHVNKYNTLIFTCQKWYHS